MPCQIILSLFPFCLVSNSRISDVPRSVYDGQTQPVRPFSTLNIIRNENGDYESAVPYAGKQAPNQYPDQVRMVGASIVTAFEEVLL